MKIKNLKERENGSISFEVESDEKQWKDALQRVSASMQKQKPVQGYRPGKAPLPAAYQVYGQTMVDQAAQAALAESISDLCKEHDYFPVSNPDIRVVTADLKSLSAVISFAVYPKVPDFDYVGIEVEKPVKTVSEADIDQAIDRYMRNHLWVHEVEREARMGDIAEVSFTGTCGGQPFEHDHSSKSRFVMGSGQLFTGLDEALVGHIAGDDLELTLTMPEDFHREAVRGKTLDLNIHLRSVCARDLLECTDEYVQEKVKGADTLAQFREIQRTGLQKQNDSKSERAFERNFQNALASLITCPIPEPMIQVSLDGFVRTLWQVCAQQGKSVEQALKEEGKTLEDFKKEAYPDALRQVKISVALDYIARKEHLTVSADAVEKRVSSYMKRANVSRDQALKALGGKEDIEEKLLNDMAADFARRHCRVTEVEVEEFPPMSAPVNA